VSGVLGCATRHKTAARASRGIAGTLHPSIRPAIKAGPPLRTGSRDITRLCVGRNPVEIHRSFFAAGTPPDGGSFSHSANNPLSRVARGDLTPGLPQIPA
jgi:hypothetical protein